MDCWWRWGISLLSSLVDERRIPLDRFWRGVYSHKQPDRVYASDCVPNQHFHGVRENVGWERNRRRKRGQVACGNRRHAKIGPEVFAFHRQVMREVIFPTATSSPSCASFI